MKRKIAPFIGAGILALLIATSIQAAIGQDWNGLDGNVPGPFYQDQFSQEPAGQEPASQEAGGQQPLLEDAQAAGAIYWGAYIQGNTYGVQNAPWDTRAIDSFEANAKKRIGILHWGQAWQRCTPTCVYQEFREQQPQYEAMRKRGIIAFVDWASWSTSVSPVYTQPNFSLGRIIAGDHDTYIRRWAREAKAWGHPFLLRFNWEMNGNWYPWSEQRNGNSSGQYTQAWRHVHDIFRAEGATNVQWVWCPNVVDGMNTIPLSLYYPGDAYVDTLCMDGYNWGAHPLEKGTWKSFTQVFALTYSELIKLSSKPILIGETGSTEYGGSKAAWITDMLNVSLPQKFPRVAAVLWFNWNVSGMDWVIESSSSATAAFADGITSSYYVAGPVSMSANSARSWFDAPALSCASGGCLYLPMITKP